MNINEALEAIEQVLLSRKLSPVEQLVFHQSWMGKAYSEMAENSGYGSIYIKEVGSHLWQDLSQALGEKVTKKNLHLVLNKYHPWSENDFDIFEQQTLQLDTKTENNFLNSVKQTEIEFPGSPVPLNSLLYINRLSIEELALGEITKPGCVIRIRAPKKMGKSSLLNRIIVNARKTGYKTVYLDFQEADVTIFSSLEKFLRWFCANISRQLQLDCKLDEYWDEEMGSKVSCKIYFQEYVLEKLNQPLVLALNEVNRIFEYPHIACDFLPMLRFWHEMAKASTTWQKLRLVVVHSTEIYIPLKLTQSPFNVGLLIKLPQFTSSEVQVLAVRYGLGWFDSSCTEQLMAMVGGHPYLVNLALYHLWKKEVTLEELLQTATSQTGIYSHHLRDYLAILHQQPELISALQKVVIADSSVQLDAIAAYKLESMGLIQLDGNWGKPSCQLYRLYFSQQMCEFASKVYS